jgi:glutaminyl-tRNA synthetase
VHCSYDAETRGGNAAGLKGNKKVKGTIHWVSADRALPLEVRVYDYLFQSERPMEVPPRPDGSPGDYLDYVNPHSLEVIEDAWGEPSLAEADIVKEPDRRYQFERVGYFVQDTDKAKDGKLVFNKTIGLRDTWGKIAKKE